MNHEDGVDVSSRYVGQMAYAASVQTENYVLVTSIENHIIIVDFITYLFKTGANLIYHEFWLQNEHSVYAFPCTSARKTVLHWWLFVGVYHISFSIFFYIHQVIIFRV